MPSLSGAQIDKLSRRLRDVDVPSDEDLRLFGMLLADHGRALEEVIEQLHGIGLDPTSRLKTYPTTIDKLRRQNITLRGVNDLGGARIVRDMTLDEQDVMVRKITALWPDAKVINRRASPSHGYRAMHVVPRVRGCRVEIQVRTHLQDAWAQVMESLGDLWGRGLRYGDGPDRPDSPVATGSTETRQAVVAGLIAAANAVAEVEQLASLARRSLGASSLSDAEHRMRSFAQYLYGLAEGLRSLRTDRIEP